MCQCRGGHFHLLLRRRVYRRWLPLCSVHLQSNRVSPCTPTLLFGAVGARRCAVVVVNVPVSPPRSCRWSACFSVPTSLTCICLSVRCSTPHTTLRGACPALSPLLPPLPLRPPSLFPCLFAWSHPASESVASPYFPWAVTARGPGRASLTRPCARIKSAPSHRWLRIVTRGWPSVPPAVPSDTYIHPSSPAVGATGTLALFQRPRWSTCYPL